MAHSPITLSYRGNKDSHCLEGEEVLLLVVYSSRPFPNKLLMLLTAVKNLLLVGAVYIYSYTLYTLLPVDFFFSFVTPLQVQRGKNNPPNQITSLFIQESQE